MAEDDPKIGVRANRTGYDEDFAAWVQEQAAALKAGRFDELDVDALADEVESLAKRDYRALVSDIYIVLLHMLKWDYQQDPRSESWRRSIREHRRRIQEELGSSPSFAARVGEAVAGAYPQARDRASEEPGVFLSLLPEECPYSWDEITSRLHEYDADRPLPR